MWDNFVKAFTEFRFYDAIDIVLISWLLYLIFAFLKRINSTGFIKYLVIGFAACAVIYIFRNQLKVTYALVAALAVSAIVLFVIIYIADVRRLLWSASAPRSLRGHYRAKFDSSDVELEDASNEIVRAVQSLAKTNTGALIVLTSAEMPRQILESGTRLDAVVSAPLLESLFFPNSVLHDGAVIVSGNKIIAAGCLLPLSQNLNLPKDLGTRHRAALGISEDTPVTAVIVSEETGIISVAKNGILSKYFDTQMLKETIGLAYGLVAVEGEKRKKKKRTNK